MLDFEVATVARRWEVHALASVAPPVPQLDEAPAYQSLVSAKPSEKGGPAVSPAIALTTSFDNVGKTSGRRSRKRKCATDSSGSCATPSVSRIHVTVEIPLPKIIAATQTSITPKASNSKARRREAHAGSSPAASCHQHTPATAQADNQSNICSKRPKETNKNVVTSFYQKVYRKAAKEATLFPPHPRRQ